jgi:hypothetical protein
MKMKLIAPMALFLLAACDGNPLGTGTGGGGGDPETSAGEVYAADLNEDLTMNSLQYDDEADELIINNIPFDGDSGPDQQARYERTGSLANGFGRYESIETAETGRRQYYAVFRQSVSGEAQVGAAGTNEYVDFGFGGATAQRTRASINLPSGNEYVYTGEYAAVRIYDERQPGAPSPGVEYITGSVELEVDIGDFDETGAIEGVIFDRVLYDVNGTVIGPLNDFITLSTAQIDAETRTILQSGASGLALDVSRTQITSGDWAGVFAGPNGEEIAGIVVLEGRTGTDPNSGTVRETGVFLTTD